MDSRVRRNLRRYSPSGARIYRWGRWLILGPWFLLSSDLRHVLELIAWFTMGVVWARSDRRGGHGGMTAEQKALENSWGFGQLVPVILLMLPAMTLFEAYHENMKKLNENRKRDTEDEIGLLSSPISSDGWNSSLLYENLELQQPSVRIDVAPPPHARSPSTSSAAEVRRRVTNFATEANPTGRTTSE
ncbi:hypothetical protein K432DRAFT_457024 [Lepidopterella palustris CBS 459.81]|uniref:Uncharacterized protein n=1 Tax=Lepidopterella palustris CBS 459.81 TaxID=1314670 RepID=A0A8E2E7E7_9PEZI|nr:hypothetical protein K432DRAFT_457024 [Lepidopterella palustris CBS 459.81]